MTWYVRRPDGTLGLELIGILNLVYRDVALAPSGWVLTLPQTDPAVSTLLQRGAGIVHTGTPYGELTGTVYPGPNDESRYSRVKTGGVDTITFHGYADRSLFWHRVVLPSSGSVTNWSATGAAHTVFTNMFDAQMGSAGLDSTRYNAVHDTDTGTPTASITLDLPRYDPIGVQLAAQLADEGMFLRTFAENDLVMFAVSEANATDIVLTLENGALTREQIDVSAISASRVYVLGAGEGTARDVREVNDTDSDVWALMEKAIDRRDVTVGDTSALDRAGTEALNVGSIGRVVEVSPAAPVAVGDQVRVEVDGTLEDRYVVAQTITIDPLNEFSTFELALNLNDTDTPPGVPSTGKKATVSGSDEALGSPTKFAAIAESSQSFTTVVGATFASVGSATTFTPPASWGTYDVTVTYEVRVSVPAGVYADLRHRVVIDGNTETTKHWLGDNPFGSTKSVTMFGVSGFAGLSGAIDVQGQAQTLGLSSGTSLTYTRFDAQIVGTRVT